MKVLQVIDSLSRSGGAEKFVLDLSLALKRNARVDVDVLSIKVPTDHEFIETLKENNINHFSFSNNLYSPSIILKLHKLIHEGKYDAVHVHLFPALYYVSICKWMFNDNFRLIYSEHSTTNKRRGNLLFKHLDRAIYKNYDNIIAISNKVKENLENHLSTNRVQIINNGIDFKAIQDAQITDIRLELGIPKEAKIITMVSRLVPGKDYKTLIKALEKSPINSHLCFIGDGPLLDDLNYTARQSKSKDRVHILGLRKDVYGILKASDIVVLSTHHEGFSISMLEAMACHKPFIASSVEGITDLVNGIAELFEYKDSFKLALILKNICEDDNYYNEVADRCYCFAKNFDINTIAQKYISVYK